MQLSDATKAQNISQVKVRGYIGDQLAFEGNVNKNRDADYSSAAGDAPTRLQAKIALPQQAQVTNYIINWKMSVGDDGAWTDIGTTKNRLYVTWSAPADPNADRFLTPIVIGIEATKGLENPTQQQRLDAIWTKFETLSVQRASDQKTMTYCASTEMLNVPIKLEDMLKTLAGDGNCNAWAELLVATCNWQGIAATNKQVTAKDGYAGFLVNNYTFAQGDGLKAGAVRDPNAPYVLIASDAGLTGYSQIQYSEAVRQDGATGQGEVKRPAAIFNNHQLVEILGRIYDPSYGTDFDTFDAWQDASIAGWFNRVPASGYFSFPDDSPFNINAFSALLIRSQKENPGERHLQLPN